MPHTCQVEWQSLCLRMRGRMRRKSASGPDRIRHQCVSCHSPSLASWCHVCYYRPKDTTFYWCCGRAGGGVRPARGRGERDLPSDSLSYQTNRTGQTGRTARMTLGVYLGEIPPRADPAGRRTGLGSSWLGSANSFTGIRFF